MTQAAELGALAFVRAVFAQSGEDVAREARFLALALLAIAIPSLLVDALLGNSAAAFLNFVIGLLTLYVQLLITFRILYLRGAAPPGYDPREMTCGRFPSVFVASLFGGFGILLGLLLLFVPGTILMALWSLSTVAIAAESLGATDGLARSWELVRPALGRVAMVGAVFVLAVTSIVLAVIAATLWLPEQEWVQLLFIDIAMPVVTLGSAVVWVNVYLGLRDRRPATT